MEAIKPPLDPVAQEERYRWLGLHLVTFLGTGFSALYAPINWWRGAPEVAAANLVIGVLHAANLLWFRRTRHATAAAVIGIVLLVGFILYSSLYLGAQIYFWLFAVPLLTFFLLGARRGLTLTGAIAVLVGGWTVLEEPRWLGNRPALDIVPSFVLVVGLVLVYEHVKSDYLERFRRLSATDSLTGLLNRRRAEAVLAEEARRSQRYGRPLSLVLLDVDHFKSVNDHWGHGAGDVVLREVASRLDGAVRATDSVGRWGGEEFVILLPETPLEGARAVAERVCAVVSARPIPPAGTITLSAGVATHGGREDPDRVVTRADTLLYRAKALGRNRVCHVAPAA